MAILNVKKLSVLPESYEASTLYLIKGSGQNDLKIYLSSADGTEIRTVDQSAEIFSDMMVISETTPDLNEVRALFWWDPSRAILFIRYTSDTLQYWVQSSPAISIPEFAGHGDLYGEADTVARSDHQHDHLVIVANW